MVVKLLGMGCTWPLLGGRVVLNRLTIVVVLAVALCTLIYSFGMVVARSTGVLG